MMNVSRWAPRLMLLSVILTACAAAPPELPPVPTNPAATGAPVATSAISTGAVSIAFGAQEFDRDTYQPLIDSFNAANPDIAVRFVPIDDLLGSGANRPNRTEQAQRVLAAADTALLARVTDAIAQQGLLYDSTPLIDADLAFNRADYTPLVLSGVQRNGTTVIVPQQVIVPLLAYNKALWTARNLPAPAPDWRWPDLVTAARALTQQQNDKTIYGVGFASSYAPLLAELTAQQRADVLSETTPTPNLDQPEIATTLTELQTLISSGALYVPEVSNEAATLDELVKAQRLALWSPQELDPATMAGLPFAPGWARLPLAGPGLLDVVHGPVMSAGTKNPQAAWRWLSFLSKQPLATGATSITDGLPARTSLRTQSAAWQALDAEGQALITSILATPRPSAASVSVNAPAYAALDGALRAVLAGTAPQTALRSAEENVAARASTPQPAGTAGPVAVATAAPTAAGATKITFTPFYADEEATRAIAKRFNESQSAIVVEVRAGTGEDPTTDTFASFGWQDGRQFTTTLDLQPYIDADARFNRADIPPALWQLRELRRNNAQHGLPLKLYLRHIAYNPSLFEAAGITPPDSAWTWERFAAVAQQLTNTRSSPPQYGFVSSNQLTDLISMLYQRGAAPMVSENGVQMPNFTDPAVQQAIRDYVNLIRSSSPHKKLTCSYRQDCSSADDSAQIYLQGRAAMLFDAGFVLTDAAARGGGASGFTPAIAPPPMLSTGVSTTDLFSLGVFISTKTQNPQAAWTWLTYLSDNIVVTSGVFPARMSQVDAAFTANAPNGAAAVYAAYKPLLLQTNAPPPTFAQWPPDSFWLFQAVDRALQGKPLADELAAAQATTEVYMTCLAGGGKPAACAKTADPNYQGVMLGDG